MPDSRLTKKIFIWDRHLNETGEIFSWSSEIKTILDSCAMPDIYSNNTVFPLKCTIKNVKEALKRKQQTILQMDCTSKPKLRTFITFKDFSILPSYITKPLSFQQRKSIAKLRLGSLEIRLETGRYNRPRLEEYQRTCLVCADMNEHTVNNYIDKIVSSQSIEDEFHFLFICHLYKNLRDIWMSKLALPVNFDTLLNSEKLKIVLNDQSNVKLTSQFIIDAYNLRSKKLNS